MGFNKGNFERKFAYISHYKDKFADLIKNEIWFYFSVLAIGVLEKNLKVYTNLWTNVPST